MELPKRGCTREDVAAALRDARAGDVAWRDGRVWSLVYDAGEDVAAVAREAYLAFFAENGLGRLAFPSLARFEREVVEMMAGLLGAEAAWGAMTSGGSESILLAVKTARDRAQAEHPAPGPPEMVLPLTAHPAFDKAAQYFGVRAVRTPVGPDFRADVAAMRAVMTDRTVLLVGSAPPWPHGVIDPIPAIAALAHERGLSMHVDACLGGCFLPFLRRLGRPVPPFDFTLEGVTSMSADLHKYGFAAKGASVVLYRDEAAWRHQPFTVDWPGGRYVSPSMAGTRPGGAIAAAWAVMQYLGEAGYLKLVERAMRATDALIAGIQGIAGLRVLGRPDMSVFAYAADGLDVVALGEALTERGWYVNRMPDPPSIHLKVDPMHERVVAAYLADLKEVVRRVRAGRERRGQATAHYA